MIIRQIILLALFSSTSFAQNFFLGTDGEDIEEGMRIYTERELSNLKKSKVSEKTTKITEENIGESGDNPGNDLWNSEIQDMLPKNDNSITNPKMSTIPSSPTPIPSLSTLSSPPKKVKKKKKTDWKMAGFRRFDKKNEPKPRTIQIPVGSHVSAFLMNGVDAPIKSAVPALLKLRFGFSGPNRTYVDLSGCRAVAKATGDLSTERVKLKSTDISCVDPEGNVFSQKMTTYAVGDDGGFGLSGELHSRQGRVAMMAFLNGVVEGATKIVSQSSGNGGEGDNPMLIGQQGSASASSEVVRWYLENAKALFPSIEVKAGTKAQLILLEPLEVPESFFRKFDSLLPHYVSHEYFSQENSHEDYDLIL